MKAKSITAFLALFLAYCNNYGLKEKFDAPDGDRILPFIFVTSLLTAGNLSTLSCGNISSPLDRADCSCTELAKSNGILQTTTSKFVAWLSDSGNDMTCRIRGIAGTGCSNTGGNPWYNTNSELVANSYQDLFDSAIPAAVSYNEKKAKVGANLTWTGTNADGTRASGATASAYCNDWTSNSAGQTAVLGLVGATNSRWSNNNNQTAGCNSVFPIICAAQQQ
jgi:hypothetical protein